MRNIKIVSLLLLLNTLTACAPQFKEEVASAVAPVADEIACAHYQFNVFQALKEYSLNHQELPVYDDFSYHLGLKLQDLVESGQITLTQKQMLEKESNELLKVLLEEMTSVAKTREEYLSLLSAVDVGDKSTAYREYLNNKIETQFSKLQTLAKETNSTCSTPEPAEPPASEFVPGQEGQNGGSTGDGQTQPVVLNPAVLGNRVLLATAYQSCNATKIPPMTAQTPDVQGIEIFGKHSDGVGSKRRIASLPSVQSSHYYIKDERSYPSTCFNVRSNPLIYDYGGKPFATTAASSPLDLFKNNGDGTSVLGIDCSGYVFSAYATAGLKLSSARPLRASDSWSWGSSSYVEPQKNGLSCLNKITVTPQTQLLAGDIVAVVGHVFLIDSVGADPLGITKASSVEGCSKLSSDDFDFVITQSSNSKNGIGINSYEARDYMKTAPKFKSGLEKYAYYACLARFNNKNYTPSLGTLSVVRHKGTKECLAPRVKLNKEECVSQCQF